MTIKDRLTKTLYLFITTFFILGVSACSDDMEFANEWDEDIYHFAKNLEDNHIDLFHQLSKEEFDGMITNLRSQSATLTEGQILVELSKILSKIGDSHTQMRFAHKLTPLNFAVRWLDDGIYLVAVNQGNSNQLGKKIVSINGYPIDEVIENYRNYITFENESNFKNHFTSLLPFLEFHQDFDADASLEEFVLQLEGGFEVQVDAEESTDKFQPASIPLFLENTSVFYRLEELIEDGILYIQYNACVESPDLTFQAFTNLIENRINNNTSIDKLVIDLRHNGGGNSSIINPLFSTLENFINTDRIQKENIYTVIGRSTFSSAVSNAIQLKDLFDNVVLGEPTGGKPNHYGEIKSFRLPHSLIQVYYSTKYFNSYPNNDDSFNPDIPIEYNSSHLLNGEDPVLDFIKAN